MTSNPIYFARVIAIPFRPETLSTVVDTYLSTSMPMIRDSPGLVSMLGLVNRTHGKASSITVWETADDRERSGITAPGAQDNLARYADLMDGAYTRDAFDVTVFTFRPVDAVEAAVARITTEEIQPARWDEGTDGLRSLARHSNAEHPEFHGAMVLENRGMGRALLIEVATTEAVLDANVGRVREHDLSARRRGYLTRRPERELYEVMVPD